MARKQNLIALVTACTSLSIVGAPSFAQKVDDLPDLPKGMNPAIHMMPPPSAPVNFTAGNSNMSITEFADGTRQKKVGGATITKWPDGTIRVDKPGSAPYYKWDNPNVVGRASSNDGTRVTLMRNGTQYTSWQTNTGRAGRVDDKNGKPILNVPAPFAPQWVQNSSNPYLNGIGASGNPYANAASSHAPPSGGDDDYDPLDPSIINALTSPIPYSSTVGAPLPPYEAGPLIDSLGTTVSPPSTPSSNTWCPDGM